MQINEYLHNTTYDKLIRLKKINKQAHKIKKS